MSRHDWPQDEDWEKELITRRQWLAFSGRRETLVMDNGGDYKLAHHHARTEWNGILSFLETEFPETGSQDGLRNTLHPASAFKGEATTLIQTIEWALDHLSVAVAIKECPNGRCWAALMAGRKDTGKFFKDQFSQLLPKRTEKPEGATSGDADDDMTMDRLLEEMTG